MNKHHLKRTVIHATAYALIYVGLLLLSSCAFAALTASPPPMAAVAPTSAPTPALDSASGSSTPTEGVKTLSMYSQSKATGEFFSTSSTLLLYDNYDDPAAKKAFEETWAAVKAELVQIDAAINSAHAGSDIARFNALKTGQSIDVTAHTAAIFTTAREVYEQSGGLYDPSIYMLVDLWGFTPRFQSADYAPTHVYDRERMGEGFALPNKKYIDAFMALTDFSMVQLNGSAQEGYTLTKGAAGVVVDGITYYQQIDLGGIGKGYAVDVITQLLKERGYTYGYFSCGGSSIGLLKRPTASDGAPLAQQWAVGIINPVAKDPLKFMRVYASDTGLSTSGDYERAYTVDGVHYSHIIDPRTGYPMNSPNPDGVQSGICSITLLHNDATRADAWSTALCLAGRQGALAMLHSPALSDCQYVMAYLDDESDAGSTYQFITNFIANGYQLMDRIHFTN